jgi:hypothetical protein
MAVQVELIGGKHIIQNLKKEVKSVISNSKKGLIQVGLLIKASSMRKTPIDLGNLRASHYVVWGGGVDTDGSFVSTGNSKEDSRLAPDHQTIIALGKSQAGMFGVLVGVSAYYAIYVHEDLQANHTVGQAKFLESAIGEYAPNALKIIKSKAKI